MEAEKAVAKRGKRKKSAVIEQDGVRVRLFKRGATWWADMWLDRVRSRESLKTGERSTAETNARNTATAMARAKLLGIKAETITLEQLFTAYAGNKGQQLIGQWKRRSETCAKFFTAAWGAALPVVAISQTSVEQYCAARRKAFSEARKKAMRDGGLDCDFRWLSSVFNWATRHKLANGNRLLQHNPLHDCTWPREKNVRRPVASQQRYTATLEHADTIDQAGRLRCILALARNTGRRESAVIQLRASDILLSAKQVALALAAAGMDERLAEHMPHGAIRWSAENDKMGVLHIAPISEDARAELELYMIASAVKGDVPLFPAPEDSRRSISRSTATKWLQRAEGLAELPKLTGGTWHPYRRLYATERQHLSDVSVAAGGGWKSTKTLKLYQQVDPASVLAAVLNH